MLPDTYYFDTLYNGFRSFYTLEKWDLPVKGEQSCQPSNFENGLTPGDLESGPTGMTRARAGLQTFL